ncbi:phage terminase large subunit-like protein [Methylobacterium sp. R2-1]|nr:phage terminase large subunit-like protein [Methylobacterium sp. R2-1]
MIQEFFWLVPKKNSKSSGAAAIMVTVLIVNRRPLAEALLVAPTKEIANIAYKQAWGIIQADPELAKLFHGQHHVRTITHRNRRQLCRGHQPVAAADACHPVRSGHQPLFRRPADRPR